MYFSSVWDIEQKLFGFFSPKFPKGCQDCIAHVQRNSFRKNMFFKNLCFFNLCGTWAKTIRLFFSPKFAKGWENCIPQIHRNRFRKNIFFNYLCFFLTFAELEQKGMAIFRNFFGGIFKTVFYLFIEKVWGKTTFWRMYVFLYFLSSWNFEQKFLAFFWKNFLRGCQNCILHLPRNSSMENNVLKNLGFFY